MLTDEPPTTRVPLLFPDPIPENLTWIQDLDSNYTMGKEGVKMFCSAVPVWQLKIFCNGRWINNKKYKETVKKDPGHSGKKLKSIAYEVGVDVYPGDFSCYCQGGFYYG